MPENPENKGFAVTVERLPESAGNRPTGTRFSLDAGGDWRPVFDGHYWWVVGHHLVYPASDRYHAERRCEELKIAK